MPRPGPQREGERQRFYARNAVKTTLEPRPAAVPGCARSFDAIFLGQLTALTGFADECCGTLARLFAYVGTLALLTIFGLHLWDRLPDDETSEPAAGPGWSTAGRAHPAFAVSQLDLPEKTETYEILRHPQGGRKDVLHRAAQGEKPVAELEIDRPGDEISPSRRARTAIGDRMDPNGGRQLERAAISCISSRLMLLPAGNDRKLAELFARAELNAAAAPHRPHPPLRRTG